MKFTIYDLRFTSGLRFGNRATNFRFVFLILSLLLTSCVRHDSTLRQELIGTWLSKSGEICISTDESFYSTFSLVGTDATIMWNYQGKWLIEDELLIMTVTNVSAINTTNSKPIGSMERYKIIKLDKTSLLTEYDRQPGVTNSYTRK